MMMSGMTGGATALPSGGAMPMATGGAPADIPVPAGDPMMPMEPVMGGAPVSNNGGEMPPYGGYSRRWSSV